MIALNWFGAQNKKTIWKSEINLEIRNQVRKDEAIDTN